MPNGKLWTHRDRFGNDIYLRDERWAHIIDQENHPEIESYFHLLSETVRLGRRRQDAYDPNGYQYYRAFPSLPDDNTHLIVCVRFRWAIDANGNAPRREVCNHRLFPSF
ncbi:hypothetical protein HUU05_19140 [candidate division KSB1 bacterium]|nr:hypothetical protein [candidate division KSB1 bacterium]